MTTLYELTWPVAQGFLLFIGFDLFFALCGKFGFEFGGLVFASLFPLMNIATKVTGVIIVFSHLISVIDEHFDLSDIDDTIKSDNVVACKDVPRNHDSSNNNSDIPLFNRLYEQYHYIMQEILRFVNALILTFQPPKCNSVEMTKLKQRPIDTNRPNADAANMDDADNTDDDDKLMRMQEPIYYKLPHDIGTTCQ